MDLNDYYDRAMDYEAYVERLGDRVDLQRLHYRKYEISPDLKKQLAELPPLRLLALTEPWCGDSLALLPVVKKIAEAAPGWELRVLLRDENPDLMDRFLTMNSRGIPIFIFLDRQGAVIFTFGPRPKAAQQIFEDHRQAIKAGDVEKGAVIRQIRTFYAKDRGKAIEKDLAALFDRHLNRVRTPAAV